MCSHKNMVAKREARLVTSDCNTWTQAPVPLDRQCRGCLKRAYHKLKAHGCVPEEDDWLAVRCGFD